MSFFFSSKSVLIYTIVNDEQKRGRKGDLLIRRTFKVSVMEELNDILQHILQHEEHKEKPTHSTFIVLYIYTVLRTFFHISCQRKLILLLLLS